MTQKKRVCVTILFFAGFLLAIALFGWFLVKMPEGPGMAPVLTDATSAPGTSMVEEPGAVGSDTAEPEATEIAAGQEPESAASEPESLAPGEDSGGEPLQVRQIWLCGRELKVPLTLQDLTEQGFTYAVISGYKGRDVRQLGVYYKGKQVSIMTVDAAENVVEMGFYEFLDGLEDFSAQGVDWQATRDFVEEKWGEGVRTSQGVRYGSGAEHMVFGYSGEDRLKYVKIYCPGGKAADPAGEGDTKAEDAPAEETETPPQAPDPAAITGGDAAANLDEVFKHVFLGGRELSFPMTMQDLADQGFSWEAAGPLSKEKKDWHFVLLDRGRRLVPMRSHSSKKGTGPGERVIHFLQLDYTESGTEDFAICGVDRESTRETVEKIWGEGKRMPWGLKYQSEKDETKSVEMYFSRNGKLSSVYIFLEG